MKKKRLFNRACPILSCYSFIVLSMYVQYFFSFCLPIYLHCDSHLYKRGYASLYWVLILCSVLYQVLSCFFIVHGCILYPWLHSTSQWAVPLLYFLWPGEAVKCCSPGHRPATSTYTHKQNILLESIAYIRYEGLFCLFLFKCSPIADTVSGKGSRQCRYAKYSPVADPLSEEGSSRQWRHAKCSLVADSRHCLTWREKQTMQTRKVLTCSRPCIRRRE